MSVTYCPLLHCVAQVSKSVDEKFGDFEIQAFMGQKKHYIKKLSEFTCELSTNWVLLLDVVLLFSSFEHHLNLTIPDRVLLFLG